MVKRINCREQDTNLKQISMWSIEVCNVDPTINKSLKKIEYQLDAASMHFGADRYNYTGRRFSVFHGIIFYLFYPFFRLGTRLKPSKKF